jgi:hypothetical protein
VTSATYINVVFENICIQFLNCSGGQALWLDEVVTFKWAAGSKSFHRTASFKAFLGIFLVLSIPWLVVGK